MARGGQETRGKTVKTGLRAQPCIRHARSISRSRQAAPRSPDSLVLAVRLVAPALAGSIVSPPRVCNAIVPEGQQPATGRPPGVEPIQAERRERPYCVIVDGQVGSPGRRQLKFARRVLEPAHRGVRIPSPLVGQQPARPQLEGVRAVLLGRRRSAAQQQHRRALQQGIGRRGQQLQRGGEGGDARPKLAAAREGQAEQLLRRRAAP
eukprot:scaffold5223_cov104-Isochrysis_galbana.AAC.4